MQPSAQHGTSFKSLLILVTSLPLESTHGHWPFHPEATGQERGECPSLRYRRTAPQACIRVPTVYQILAQMLFCLPNKPRGRRKEPRTDGKPTEAQRARICLRSTQAPPCTHRLRPRAAPRHPPAHLSDYESLGVSGYGTPPKTPTLTYGFCHLWEGCGLGVEAASLLPLLAGHWPFKAAAARACPGVTPRGGCGQEQGAHSAAAATSGQPTGWPGWEAGRRLAKAGTDSV